MAEGNSGLSTVRVIVRGVASSDWQAAGRMGMKNQRVRYMYKYLILLVIYCFPVMRVEAQPFPTKPIRLLIGFAPGGGTDVTARVLTQQLYEKFGQPIV